MACDYVRKEGEANKEGGWEGWRICLCWLALNSEDGPKMASKLTPVPAGHGPPLASGHCLAGTGREGRDENSSFGYVGESSAVRSGDVVFGYLYVCTDPNVTRAACLFAVRALPYSIGRPERQCGCGGRV
jgi:hypothetical protein